jgi:hypothetical protein
VTETLAARCESTDDQSLRIAFKAPSVSLLELFHPDGAPKRWLVLGSGCPLSLLPAWRGKAWAEADLIILAPTDSECRIFHWLEWAVRETAQKLSRDGVVYILASPRWRRTIGNLLKNHGLFKERFVIHLPNTASSRFLVPLEPVPVNYVLSQSISSAPWIASLAVAGARFNWSNALLGSLLPSLAFVVRRRGARPIFHWLFQMHPADNRPGHVLIGASWRGRESAVIIHRFSDGTAAPTAVAKLNLTKAGAARRLREAKMLTSLGRAARSAGARIPQLWSVRRLHGSPVLLQSPIKGQSFARLLNSYPNRLIEALESITVWLEHWNRETLILRPLQSGLIEQELLAPTASLESILERGNSYRKWLQKTSERLIGVPTPLVATHNDLTMWNIVRQDHKSIGVIDWETARRTGLPLVDFFYAAVDGVAATQGYADRFKAFRDCFLPGGTYEPVVRRLARRLQNGVRVSDEIVELSFHSCWLQHAENEYRSTDKTQGAFIKIVQWLGANRSQINSWIRG